MKEQSIEQKAKRYDEALELAKKLQQTEVLSGKNVRPLSSMTNIERQEWGLILVDELEEDPYSWLVRHNFLEAKEIDIGLPKNLKGPNPPIYL